ncbi:1-acyl-sn-glycerol-3-phosphate acyltransferase [Sulfurimonas sp.]|uniref:1-acyl-sn-glycerol-3-phosphate acyltransferase n=1 Tax=Sulfurimonas sp. TaxID=2022749 RepID=UPI003D10C011
MSEYSSEFIYLFVGSIVILYTVFYFYFSKKHYSRPQHYNIFNPITKKMLQKSVIFELFFYTFFFFTTLYYAIILFEEQLSYIYLNYLAFGVALGVFLLYKTSKYYIHEGLIGLGSFITLILMTTLFFDRSLVSHPSFLFLVGFSLGITLPTLYGRLLHTYSRKFTTIFSILSLLLLIAIFNVLTYLIGHSFSVFYTLLAIFIIINAYLFWIYKVIAHWIFFDIIISLRYKVIYKGLENLDENHGICLISNHLSWLDWLIIQLPIQRRIHYFINSTVAKKIAFRYFVNGGGCITMSKKGASKAIRTGKKLLHNKQIVGIFPEGSISKTGKLGGFKSGFTLLSSVHDSQIIPVYLDGLWGSIFSRSPKKFQFHKKHFPRRTITITFGQALPMTTTVEDVKKAIGSLRT